VSNLVRDRLLARFAPGGQIEAIEPDASTRSFFRLRRTDGATRVVVVDEAGGTPALARMEAARDALAEAGVRVPRIERRDEPLRALLMEDLGGNLLADALSGLDQEAQRALYREAGAMAGRITARATPLVGEEHLLARPQLDRERLRMELGFFLVHDIAGRRGIHDRSLLGALGDFLDWIADEVASGEPCLAHRDFHARNLLLQEDGHLAVVDFQDALLAPALYDLASLVRDPYVEPGGALEEAAREGFAAEAGDFDSRRLAWTALQRDLKALGTYAYQVRIRGRALFEPAIPRAESLVGRALRELPREVSHEATPLFRQIGLLH
jgi:hypothetical protein